VKGYPLDLILTVGFNLDGAGVSSSSGLAWMKQSIVGAMATGFRELKLALWVTKLRSNSSYVI
jgi:hypothetical protein